MLCVSTDARSRWTYMRGTTVARENGEAPRQGLYVLRTSVTTSSESVFKVQAP